MIRIIEKEERLKVKLKWLYSEWDGKNLAMEQEIQDVEEELEEMGVEL